jgi:hypothetical protein
VSALHSTPINFGNPGATLPSVLIGDADATKVIQESLHPVVQIKHNSGGGAVWAVVEVFEMRKPF